MFPRTLTFRLAVAGAALLAACAEPSSSPRGAAPAERGVDAMARLEPTRGSTATGSAIFRQQDGELIVTVSLTGLPPNSEHGFHVHERGDCSGGDGMAAGGHFNPTQMPHGPQGAAHHAGDMPSLVADASGAVRTTFRLQGPTLGTGAGAADIVGRGLIVHAQADDYTTQPTGNSGGRVACGVIARG